MDSNFNSRHQAFRKELKSYHDAINRTNRYSLQKIRGKLNIFEDGDGEREDDASYEIDRTIPNTGLTVLKREDMYAIGNIDGKPLTKFKYQFIEGCLGEHDKIVRCITDNGEIEDFSVETETILEDACAATGMPATCGMGAGDISCGGEGSCDCGGDHSEIDYSDVQKQLMIPYLCGARFVDMKSRRRRKKRRRRS